MIDTLFKHGMSYRYRGGGGPDLPAKQAPAARVETRREADIAKQKVRKKARSATGRQSQILAGQLNQRRAADTELARILG